MATPKLTDLLTYSEVITYALRFNQRIPSSDCRRAIEQHLSLLRSIQTSLRRGAAKSRARKAAKAAKQGRQHGT